VSAAHTRGARIIIAFFLSLALSACEPAKEGPLGLEVVSASVERDLRTNAPTVFVHLTDSCSRRFAQFTVANIEEFFDFRVNSRTVFKPTIREPITGGIILIPMQRQEDAEDLAARLADGKATLEVALAPN